MLFSSVVLNFHREDRSNNSMYTLMLDDVSIGYIMTHPPIEDSATRPTKKLFVFLRNQLGASSILILLHVTIQTVERIYCLCILILFYSMVSRRTKGP